MLNKKKWAEVSAVLCELIKIIMKKSTLTFHFSPLGFFLFLICFQNENRVGKFSTLVTRLKEGFCKVVLVTIAFLVQLPGNSKQKGKLLSLCDSINFNL